MTDEPIPDEAARELERVRPRLGRIARELHWHRVAGSTNDLAARLAEAGCAEGATVIADAQTAGRGRYGRSWFSPAGAGLYVSVVFRPSAPPMLLTLASGVAIAEAVRSITGLPAELKWPNDVLVHRRKLAGILAEAVASGGGVQFVVVGFGVNLQAAAYPAELAARVTSIEAETNRPADGPRLLAEILASLNQRYGELEAGRFDAILGAWRALAPMAASRAAVEWDSPAGRVSGRADGVDDSGALLIRTAAGVERVLSGEVRWL